MSRKELVGIWKDTEKYCRNVKVTPELKTVKYKGLIDDFCLEPHFSTTEVDVQNKDTFVLAKDMLDKGLNPLVLNMASSYICGGGVRKGCRAQEEELFRRSDYAAFVPKSFYPLDETDVLYTPKVTVIKDENNYLLKTKDRFSVSAIACAAIRHPKVSKNDTESERCCYSVLRDATLMKYKIQTIFQTAYFYGHDSVCFGALGCGAFANPSYRVAEMFAEVIEEYNGCFDKIYFAVYSTRDHNYQIFKEVLVDNLNLANNVVMK